MPRRIVGDRKGTGRNHTVNRYKRFHMGRAGWKDRRKVQYQVKDRLFRFLFEKDREALLDLYNALNGTAYQDASVLKTVTIENAVYVVMKNDLAFVIAGTLNLYEHQSTCNPNMPVRFLIYLAEEYQRLIEQAEESIYGSKRIILPAPQCVVFYNGEREIPEEQELRLSEAFENQSAKADVELKVRMLNINYGKNRELMAKCRVLREYSLFVEMARQYIKDGKDRQGALKMAIDYCIDHNILSDFLRSYRAEVLGMLLEEFDVDKYERSLKAEGIQEGVEKGMEKGIEKGIERMAVLTEKLMELNRMEDLRRMTTDQEHREKLFREFGI